jgi:hypothetical protein
MREKSFLLLFGRQFDNNYYLIIRFLGTDLIAILTCVGKVVHTNIFTGVIIYNTTG